MAKKCALFDNRVIQSGEISIAITKQFLKKKKRQKFILHSF